MAELQDGPESGMKLPKTSRDVKISMRREHVKRLLQAGHTISKIASELKFSRKIIAKDIKVCVATQTLMDPDAMFFVLYSRYEDRRARAVDAYRNGKSASARLRAIKLLHRIDMAWLNFTVDYGLFHPREKEEVTLRWLYPGETYAPKNGQDAAQKPTAG